MQPLSGGFRLVLRPDRPADAHGDFGHVALSVESLSVLKVWAEHLDKAGVPHEDIKESPTGLTNDLADLDGHQIELAYEHLSFSNSDGSRRDIEVFRVRARSHFSVALAEAPWGQGLQSARSSPVSFERAADCHWNRWCPPSRVRVPPTTSQP
jgi:hypothetical protein